ncbi:amidophosphoribosyltransferase [Halobellus limi]|uniref:Amidophosphoribosyltransferase n=1 Tax=Halobellus limi TaxID=699433 RepID=A0A1H5UAN4_9EURY|nr:amidophosphoribosyltransferase [Halobellus limi]QCC47092.1 amidophosphoribosyltransferase [Halobellus limi]SEF72059.1 amidophosphoribosyltransferase [Halobellus limi]
MPDGRDLSNPTPGREPTNAESSTDDPPAATSAQATPPGADLSGPTEKCGVVGVALEDRAASRPLYYSLYALQHRGQESAGIVTHDGFQQHSHVEMGLVGDAFGEGDLDSLAGRTGIGHVRYPTSGGVNASCAQPFSVSFKSGSLGLSHNGNLVNADEIREELANLGHAFTSDGDTEVIAHDLARNLLEADLVRAVKRTMDRIHGSYALTIMHDETVLAVRDPQGNRPLCIGKLEDGYVVASESAAIDTLDGELVRDVRPGELVVLEPDGSGFDSYQLVEREDTAHCFFEHVYFARPDSIIDESLVYEARRDLGRKLWAESGIETDVVMPVPDSGRSFASGYAEAANETTASGEERPAEEEAVEFAEGLMKNRYVGRTFIMPTQDERERAVRLKLNPIKSTIEGKSVTIIDDSIVRGTTSRQLVSLLKDAGAEEVHVRIGAPPIVAPCYMGIDMASREELIAADRSIEEIREEIHADSLGYLSIDAVADVLGESRLDLCLGCVTGEYPYDIDGEDTDRDVQRPVIGDGATASADD